MLFVCTLQHTKAMEETSTLVRTMIDRNRPHNKSSMTNLINQLCLEKSQNGLECPKWSFNAICC